MTGLRAWSVTPLRSGFSVSVISSRRRTARHPQWLVTGASWEDAVISDEPNGTPGMYSNQEAGAQIAFVLICAHFFSNGAWLEEDQLLRN